MRIDRLTLRLDHLQFLTIRMYLGLVFSLLLLLSGLALWQ